MESIENKEIFVVQLEYVLFFSFIFIYVQGLYFLVVVSKEMDFDLCLLDIVKIWWGGCIICVELLEDICQVYVVELELENFLVLFVFCGCLKIFLFFVRVVVEIVIQNGIFLLVLSSVFYYFEVLCVVCLLFNLVQV